MAHTEEQLDQVSRDTVQNQQMVEPRMPFHILFGK